MIIMHRMTTLILLFSALISSINAFQLDPDLCPDGPSSSISDQRWRPIPGRFEIITECTSENTIFEVSQSFTQNRDSITLNSAAGTFRFYTNLNELEHLTVLNARSNGNLLPICIRESIGPNSQTSVVQRNSLLIKPSVLLGYDQFNKKNLKWGVSYVGDTLMRGIPTQIFKSCFSLDDINATVSANYYISDPDKFQSYLGPNQTYVLQIDVRVKNRAGQSDQFVYHVFRYTPNPRRIREQQSLETPDGVYCEGRTSKLSIPTNIPERFSLNSEIFLPKFQNSIYSYHGLYDMELEITRLDMWYPDPRGSTNVFHYSEIHDFATGLSFRFNNANRQCEVTNITILSSDAVVSVDNANLVEISSPAHLFLLDDTIYQYTGEKSCRDYIVCHVWISETSSNNRTEHREWYWASSVNGRPVAQSFPVKFINKQYEGLSLVNSYEASIFNFRRNPFSLLEVDSILADCYRALGPSLNYNIAVLSFKLQYPGVSDLIPNLNYLRIQVREKLTRILSIRTIRISNIVIDIDEQRNLVVTFFVLDVPPTFGVVQDPLKEKSLEEAIGLLEKAINENEFFVRVRIGNVQTKVRAVSQSLNVQHRTNEEKTITSGPRIVGLWIGFIFVGLFFGMIGGFFLFRKMARH